MTIFEIANFILDTSNCGVVGFDGMSTPVFGNGDDLIDPMKKTWGDA